MGCDAFPRQRTFLPVKVFIGAELEEGEWRWGTGVM
jgi:hypothetical protein